MQELETERRKAVEANIEQMSTVRKIREETMEAKKADVDAVIEKLEQVSIFSLLVCFNMSIFSTDE